MLINLSVKNYILIHDLEIGFGKGFSVITGETGAGKSILLGALSLILGQRADSVALPDRSGKCIIEGQFSISDYNLESFFSDNGLDYDETVILRREIAPGGKSRAFINDTPVNLSLLKDLGDRLVNVHSQNSVITLNDSDFQLAVIDSYAGIQKEVTDFRGRYSRYARLKKQLAEMEKTEAEAAGERDYFRFLLDELIQASLRPGEMEEIESELSLLTHAGEIGNNLQRTNQWLAGSEENVLGLLTEALRSLALAAKFQPELDRLRERLNADYIDIKDLSKDLTHFEEQVTADPAKLESLSQRLDQLQRLMKKHKVSTIGQLLDKRYELDNRVADEMGLAEKIATLKNEIAIAEAALVERAGKLSAKRRHILTGFEKEIISVLVKLGIPMARFTIEMWNSGTISKDGLDKVKFLFSANKGVDLKEVSATASGGELSRLMLAIKSMISQKNLLPTIIFDEIDNGVSGETAGRVGSILKKMGGFMQVVAITHLPQIAAKGESHFMVYKSEKGRSAETYIRRLKAGERAKEIAKMLSSEIVTDSALQTANDLLNN